MKITGIQIMQGEYEGRKYDNVKFHCTDDFNSNATAWGSSVFSFSVKRENVNKQLEIYGGDFDSMLGLEIQPLYNRYGKVDSISILD